jgi:hypothetical protein
MPAVQPPVADLIARALFLPIISLVLLLAPPPPVAAAPLASGALPAAVEQAEADAAKWLQGQMVPNDVVPSPDPNRRRLLVSYRVPADDPAYRYVYGRSFIYDNALGAIAFTMLGRYREAEFILNALGHLVRADGSLWFGYNTQNDWPSENDHEGAIIRTGAVAWVGYAFTYYLSVRTNKNAELVQDDPIAAGYRNTALAIASFLATSLVTDPSDTRRGLLTGGLGTSTVAVGQGSPVPTENFDPAKARWVSMEHNIDAWFFLRDLARLTGQADLAATAEGIRGRLMDLWSERDGQFFQGIHDDGSVDTVLPLDGASWGALFLAAQGREGQARRSTAAMQDRFSSEAAGVRGYRPYGPEPIYTDPRVNAYYFPAKPGMRWQELPFVWGEGSLGAAAALARTGQAEGAVKVMDSLLALSESGGVRYATSPVAWQFASYPSVASTAWYIIATEMLRGGPAAASFWGP